jgi:hypothetical protein
MNPERWDCTEFDLWRDGRVAEGAPLLRAYRGNFIEGSNPSLSAIYKKPDFKSGFLYMAERDCLRSLRFERRVASQTAEGCPAGAKNLA